MKSDLSKRGGSNLRYIRHLRNMSAEDLSAKMMELFGEDVSASAIMKYESGERPITQEHTSKFASCLGCNIATLMDGLDLSQTQTTTIQELRSLPRVVHEIFYWVATKWHGNIVSLATAFGLYAATPARYRRYAMMELLSQIDRAVSEGAIRWEDIPSCIRQGIPALQRSLGSLYDEDSEIDS